MLYLSHHVFNILKEQDIQICDFVKLAILSDFHLGYERFRDDAYKQAEEALELASKSADVLLIPGDIFDMRVPRPEILAEAINLFRNLSKKEWKAKVKEVNALHKVYTTIPVIAIPGTHESRARVDENPVTLLGLAGLLVDVSDGSAVVEKDGERVFVFGVGGVSDDRFAESIQRLEPKPRSGCFNVFMFHQSVFELLSFSEDFIHIDELPKGFDLYIDGHIHNRIEMKVHGKPFIIPGSTVLTQLKSAEQEEKGFYVYDTKDDSCLFIKINSRRFVIAKVSVDGRGTEELTASIKKEIESAISCKEDRPVIRIEIDGKLKGGARSIDIDFTGIANAYRGRATIEISKPGIDNIGLDEEASALRGGSLENMSVKDYGLGMFMEKLKQSKYDLSISPSELFELLSSDTSKEKTLKKAIEELFPD
jgi:DNA repair exonuclease SbcCD nuclease subunit